MADCTESAARIRVVVSGSDDTLVDCVDCGVGTRVAVMESDSVKASDRIGHALATRISS